MTMAAEIKNRMQTVPNTPGGIGGQAGSVNIKNTTQPKSGGCC